MIRINLIKQKKPSKVRLVAPLVAVAALAVVSGFYVKSVGRADTPEVRAVRKVVRASFPASETAEPRKREDSVKSSAASETAEPRKREDSAKSSPASEVAEPRKRKQSAKSSSFKVAGFMNFTGTNSAMLVSGGNVRWVEKGENAFGLKIANIKEEGIFASTVAEPGNTVFFPLEK